MSQANHGSSSGGAGLGGLSGVAGQPCMPFQSPPKYAHRTTSSHSITSSHPMMAQRTGSFSSATPMVVRADGLQRSGRAEFAFFDRIDALRELRALREAEILQTHTLGFAILVRLPQCVKTGHRHYSFCCAQEWGAETNYTVQRGARTIAHALTTNPLEYPLVQEVVYTIKTVIKTLRAVAKGEWKFGGEEFSVEQLRAMRAQQSGQGYFPHQAYPSVGCEEQDAYPQHEDHAAEVANDAPRDVCVRLWLAA